MQHYRPSGFKLLPDVVKNLLIINGLMFLASNVLIGSFGINLWDEFGLHWVGSSKFEIYQVITYMFMHGDLGHIFFNMFAVWMLGSAIENAWGPRRFLTYYLLTGLGAAFTHYVIVYFFDLAPALELMNNFINDPTRESLSTFLGELGGFQVSERYPMMNELLNDSRASLNAVLSGSASAIQIDTAREFMIQYKEFYKALPNVVGASGSLFGILLAFGMLFPNARLFLIFIPFPIKAKYFVAGYGAIELFQGLAMNPGDNVAHFAHLGGMIFGFILIKFWQKNKRNNLQQF